MDYKLIKKTAPIVEKEIYPDGANSPTLYKEYPCFCGQGKIVEEHIVGFNDHYITLECKECEKRYHSFIDSSGNDWKVYIKENGKN